MICSILARRVRFDCRPARSAHGLAWAAAEPASRGRSGASGYGSSVTPRVEHRARFSSSATSAAGLRVLLVAGALVALLGGGCVRPPSPPTTTAEVAAGAVGAGIEAGAPERVPVVLVPGLTGSMLRDRETGKVVWGRGLNVLWPRDGGAALALPVAGEPRLEAFAVLERIRLGPIKREVYAPLLQALEAAGYRRSRTDPLNTSAHVTIDGAADLHTFAYDWRQSAVEAARGLAEALEGLRRARGEEELRIDLICQSSGAYVCRWLAKYGGASLDEAQAGGAGGTRTVRVRRLVLVGVADGGALRTLRELDRGRRYVALVGRRMLPEVLFTFPALYEDLPHDGGDLFLGHDGEPLAVDLYDPESWERYGWSALGPEAGRRLERRGARTGPERRLFGTARERRAFLARQLAAARRFQDLLARDPEGFDPAASGLRYYLVGNAYAETPRRAVLFEDGGRWRMLFTGDGQLEELPYPKVRATAPGDGHSTLESMLHLSPAEQEAVAAEPFFIQGGHFEMILEPAAHRRILEFLLEE